jgi:hypothetical protein
MFTFKDAMAADIHSTFFNTNEFAVPAVINGVEMDIVPDDLALEKYNLKAEGEGLTSGELLFFAPVSSFVEKPFVGLRLRVDNKPYEVLNLTESLGVYSIVLEGYRS